jgi:hypothetical protein
VSWLKAALFDDNTTYIPDTVAKISELIGDSLPILTDELIGQIIATFDLPNNTVKKNGVWNGKGYELAHLDDVKVFLKQHKGKQIFTISW